MPKLTQRRNQSLKSISFRLDEARKEMLNNIKSGETKSISRLINEYLQELTNKDTEDLKISLRRSEMLVSDTVRRSPYQVRLSKDSEHFLRELVKRTGYSGSSILRLAVNMAFKESVAQGVQ